VLLIETFSNQGFFSMVTKVTLKVALNMFSKAARDKYRLKLPYSLYLEMCYDGKKRLGRLVNLSTKGACVEFLERGGLPATNSETMLQLLLPEQYEPFSLGATVVWIRKLANDTNSRFVNLAVKFKNLDAKTYDFIWCFIVDSSVEA
jgi:hypothetical protein